MSIHNGNGNGNEAVVEKRRSIHFAFECPHCHEAIRLSAGCEVSLFGVSAVETQQPPPANDDDSRFTHSETLLIKRAENTGLLKAFLDALSEAAISQPRDHSRYFLHFLRTMQPRVIPGCILTLFKDQFPNTYLTFFAAQGLGCVVVDGVIRQFVPIQMLVGRRIQKIGTARHGGAAEPRFDVDEAEVINWIKTRRGYVPAQCKEFLQTLQKQSLGSFDRPSVSS